MRLIKIRPGSTIIEQGGKTIDHLGSTTISWHGGCVQLKRNTLYVILNAREKLPVSIKDRIRNDDIANITGTTSCIGDCCSSVSSKLDCGLDNVFKFPSKQRFFKKNLPSLKWVPGNFLKSKDDQCGIDFVTRFIY